MKKAGRRQQFMYQHRNRGIPNLMLWIVLGNAVVYLLTRISTEGYLLLQLLRFHAALILQGQIWRIVTFLFTYLAESNLFLGALSLFLYYWFGKLLEQYWGTLRFNLFYGVGVLIGVGLAMAIELLRLAGLPLYSVYLSAMHLNMSLFLAVATLQPEAQVRIWFVLPVKMKWVAWFDIAVTAYSVIQGIILMLTRLKTGIYLGWLLPIAALANYLIFFGKQAKYLLPEFLTARPKKVKAKTTKANPNWAAGYRSSTGKTPYRFKCTVCGRTDSSNPELEFRYCSRCAGYRCYCTEHINNHAHIQQ